MSDQLLFANPRILHGFRAVGLWLCFAVAVGSSATLWAKDPAVPAPFVTVEQGVVVGVAEAGVKRYLGIPYARPPVKSWRWAPPRPARDWAAPLMADQFGPACPQRVTETLGPEDMAEDCLSLNVWSSADAGAKRPVMVWIHGGGFTSGSGRIAGATFASPVVGNDVGQGAVLVSLNYRLGLLGFFAHPAVKQPSANFGLLDLALALTWIRDNIKEFGGDPNNVTLFGVSAGGEAISLLLTSPKSKGLFHKAIVQSGYATWALPRTQRSSSDDIRGMDGAPAVNAEALATQQIGSIIKGRQRLRNLNRISPMQLVEAVEGFGLPIVDGRSLPEEPAVAFLQGKQHRVPLLTGANSYEGSIMPASGITPEQYAGWHAAQTARMRELYAKDFARSEAFGLSAVFGDARYLLAARVLSRAWARTPRPVPTWLYFLDYVPSEQAEIWPGSSHGYDSHLLFSGHESKNPTTVELTQRLRRYWLNFAEYGNPNGTVASASESTLEMAPKEVELVRWPKYDPGQDQWLVFGSEDRMRNGIRRAKLDWLEQGYRDRVSLGQNTKTDLGTESRMNNE